MLSGKLWPAHPQPLPDELLTSWIVRVAEANGVKLQVLSWMLFGNTNSPWNRDVDRSAPRWLIKAMASHTGVDYWDVYRTTLTAYRTRLYAKRRLSGQLPWVLPIKSHGMVHEGFGVQFCPECLATDPIPYFRKQWRVALFTFCPVHDVQLYDACPVCGLPVMYYRRDFGKELEAAGPICACYACRFDFRNAVRVSPEFATQEIENLFREMLASLRAPPEQSGRFDLGFFTVLHQLIRIMGMRQNGDRFRRHLVECVGCDLPPMQLGRISIEFRTRLVRHHLLSLGLWLLADLSTRLLVAWRARAVRYNLLIKDLSEAPAEYTKVVKDLRAKSQN